MTETSTTTAAPATAAPSTTAPTAPASPSALPQPVATSAGTISDAAYDQLPTDADRERFSRVRAGPDGGSIWKERATLPSETTATTGQPGEQPNAALNPTEVYKFGDLELSGQQILDLLKHKGEPDLRRAAVPADATQYSLPEKLPADALPPWRPNSPRHC